MDWGADMWGQGPQAGFQNALAMGLQFGQQAAEAKNRQEYRNALAGFDPSKPETLQPVMKIAPEVGMQLRGQIGAQQAAAVEAEAAAQARRLKQLPILTNLLESTTDQASYERNVAAARQYGIDTSTLPGQFDPAWRDQQLATMRALQTPEGQQALSTIGKEVADMGFRPGTPEFSAKVSELWPKTQSKTISYVPGGNVIERNPVTGETVQLVQGAGQGGVSAPQPGMVEDGYRFKGGNPADPNSWEPVTGGGGSNVTGNFPRP